ncbi:MaoC family dehydratase N-terminal domain-containing protein [Shinella sp. CPCC 100929]|uniref:MaoC family dehydratase N-terminal domain-containing protein n=1 Tax=Shinella lacus TaxID=2654216 RepID=A0ABT1R1C9_9HYPH|nr:MaoC family dehydratase N-terminal domain-containing protein [Shinella lacus]MCQ4628973.1 MaoC family dehydratase N-terminal domain-containing protein [Shinella lacus]
MNVQDYVGRTDIRRDVICRHALRRLAATLDIDEPTTLPPLWHWMLFQEWPRPSGIGADGHPRRGGFLPPLVDLSRRMYAGGRISFLTPLQAGDEVTRKSTILNVKERVGRSGAIVIVTIGHEISGPDGPTILEEQDLVYLGPRDASGRAPEPAEAACAGATSVELVPDPLLLFRYSCLTGNGHRIHYDLEYTREEENYPSLVVHGPLQATLLAKLAGEIQNGSVMTGFTFKALHPAFHGNTLRLEGWNEDGHVKVRSLDAGGALCVDATATFS